MWVADLQCDQGHQFEGWFASSEAHADQQERGLLSCPLCGSHEVHRRLSVPRINVAHLRSERPADGAQPSASASSGREDADAAQQHEVTGASASTPQAAAAAGQASASALQVPARALQAAYLELVRNIVRNTEDVGNRFADEARRIHQGDAPQRAIRGQTSAQEHQELVDEGISVLSLPIPQGLDGPLQ